MAIRRIARYIDDDEDERRRWLRIQRKHLRDSSDPFNIHEQEFIGLYRLTQELVLKLCEEISPHMKSGEIPKEFRVLVALSFLAEGGFQRKNGVVYIIPVSQTVVSRSIKEFCASVDKYLSHKYIKFPTSRSQINNTKLGFYEKFGFSGVLGCIDCTHISMIAPEKRIEHVYLNRHLYHSINVQLVCDSNLQILNVNAKYGGSNHDATIWRKSYVKAHLYNSYGNENLRNTWLLGDSGYPLEPWLMTPIDNPTSISEENYNKKHISTRNCIERLNGVLKSRWACLSKARTIKYTPDMVGIIVNTCATLHNYLKYHGYEDSYDNSTNDGAEDENDPLRIDVDISHQLLVIGRSVRATIVNGYS